MSEPALRRAMRPQKEPQPPAPGSAPAPAPLPELNFFDIGAILGDDPSPDQLLPSFMEAPPAAVAAPPPSPASTSGLTRVTPKLKNDLALLRRVLAEMPNLPPDLSKRPGVRETVVKYVLAQHRTRVDENIPLHRLAKRNKAEHVAEFADIMMRMGHKTHVHTKNKHGETPLHLAGGAAAARALLKRGARLDALDRLGNTPIHLAVRDQRIETLACLLEGEPDYSLLDMKNLEGYTALHLAVIHQPVSEPHRRALQLLIQEGADVNIADDTGGRTALFHAVLRGDELAVRELVQSRAAVNFADFSETTPLQAAEDVLPASDNHICSILLEHGGFKVPPADRVTQSGRRAGAGGRGRGR